MCVAAMLRHAACETAKADIDDSPGAWRTPEWSLQFVAGHGPDSSSKQPTDDPLHGCRKLESRSIDVPRKARSKDDTYPRFSHLPLPNIGYPHADGMIRRVIISEPWGGDGQSARWAAQRLAGTVLEDEDHVPVARLERIEPNEDKAEFAKVFRHCIAHSPAGAATTWTSITPLILPGYDDGKPAKRHKLLLDSLRHAGIDAATRRRWSRQRQGWRSRSAGR